MSWRSNIFMILLQKHSFTVFIFTVIAIIFLIVPVNMPLMIFGVAALLLTPAMGLSETTIPKVGFNVFMFVALFIALSISSYKLITLDKIRSDLPHIIVSQYSYNPKSQHFSVLDGKEETLRISITTDDILKIIKTEGNISIKAWENNEYWDEKVKKYYKIDWSDDVNSSVSD